MPSQNATSKQTVVRGWEYCIPKFGTAGAAIPVGALVGFNDNGLIVPLGTATTGLGTVRVAVPRRQHGMGELGNKQSFAAGEEVSYVCPPPGTEVLLNLGASQTVTTGTPVGSNGTNGQVATGVAQTGVDVGDVVPPEEVASGPAADLAAWSVTTAAGETKKVIVEVTQ